MQTTRDLLLDVFDRLFAKAADKLHVTYTADELADERRRFEHRFGAVLDAVAPIHVEAIPPEVVTEMEHAIETLSPGQVVGQLASIPIAHQAQEMLRMVAFRAAEQRLIEHAMRQADDRFGGN